jgi:DNA-binding CsgD family transcriptional regulator
VILVFGFAFGGSRIWTFPGAATLLGTVFVSRYVGDIESRVVTSVAGVEIKLPPWQLEGIEGWRGRLWARLIDPTTWIGLVYLIGQFPIGIAAFVSLVTIFGVAGAFVTAPFILLFSDETLELLQSDRLTILIDSPVEALWMIPVGILIFLAALHFVTAFSALHAIWARFMLSSPPAFSRSPRSSGPPDLSRAPAGDRDSGTPGKAGESRQSGADFSQRPVSAEVRQFSSEPRPAPVAKPPPRVQSAAQARLSHLTQREREILLLITEGMTNAEIAETCVISQGTVKTHVKHILAKLELRDWAQVVVFAYETGAVVLETRDWRQTTAGI